MIGAPGGTSKLGNLRLPFFAGGGTAVRPRRASVDKALPNRSPDICDKCSAAW